MAHNVPFQSSSPSTPSSATIVETLDQGGGIQRQVIQLGSLSATVSIPISSGTVTLSSNPTVIPSSNVNVVIVGVPAVTVTSGTITPSSAVQVTLTSNTVALSSVATVTPSSVVSVALSSAPPFTLSSAIQISSGTVTLSSNPTVIASSAVQVTLTSNVVALSSVATVTPSSAIAISSGTVTLSSNPTVILSSVVTVQGDVANAAADSGNPLKIGGIYNSTNPTSVTSGQRVNAWFDKSGKQIAISALRTLKGVQLTAISCSVTETNITPSSTGGNFIDIYGLVLTNMSSANTQQVTVKDSSGGTSRMVFMVPAGDIRGFMVPVDGAMVQSGTSQAWTATLSNSSGTFQVTALYVTNI